MRPQDFTKDDYLKFYTDMTTDSGWNFNINAQMDIYVVLMTPNGGQAQLDIPRNIWDAAVDWFVKLSASGFWDAEDEPKEDIALYLGEKDAIGTHEWQFNANLFWYVEGDIPGRADKREKNPGVSIHAGRETIGFFVFKPQDFKAFVDWYTSDSEQQVAA